MSYPIVELISQNVVDVLSRVAESTGYNGTLIVERQKRSGNIPRDRLVVVHQDDPIPLDGAHGHTTWNQPYVVTCYVIESETSDTPIDQRVNFIRSDVEKAVMEDVTRGGYAILTSLEKPELFDAKDGSFFGIDVHFTVTYRTIQDDPYVQQ
jgi:hypothetical protein